MTRYAELAVTSNFSFLRGASHPEELIMTAKELGLAAIGIADRNTFAGVVRAHQAAKEYGVRLIVGTRLVTREGFEVIAYPQDRTAYGCLCKLLTLGKRRTRKGECDLGLDDVIAAEEGQHFIIMPPQIWDDAFVRNARKLAQGASRPTHLALTSLHVPDNARRLARLKALAQSLSVSTLATNDIHYHVAGRQMLQDVLTCIREKTTIERAGFRLFANAERHLKSGAEMQHLFAQDPEAIAQTTRLADKLTFNLDELRYEYPAEIQGESASPQAELERLTWEGAARLYPCGLPAKVRDQLVHELKLIGTLEYAPYFLTVWDVVQYARSQDILCQGRGSAANSAVCYVLGITAVDPTDMNLLFERFVSAERGEPPDIDVDFEHERREEVMQYIYRRYGRARAGIAATVISYRGKSAIRDVGKVLGLSDDIVGALASNIWGFSRGEPEDKRLRELGLDPRDRTLSLALHLAEELYGFPRHLSQHVGGFVITRGPLEELVPIGNAAMDERTFVEWDKDDLDALGILKIDVLALGMLTCIAKAFVLLKAHYGLTMDLNTLKPDDPAVYEMLARGDSLGVFQVESRAQMSMLPRLKPKTFFDLVIEVAIVRPGPIQGDMVHPYLKRREGKQPVDYPTEELREVLESTLGVPLFQEQCMQIAIVAAGFTPEEADKLRRAMATFKRLGTIHSFAEKFITGMVSRGYTQDFAERCFRQIEGFGNYGFPMSHAASFALLVYISAWLKCHYPEVFCAAILNAQPMGFYAPAQLVRDAKDHGVTVLPPDINHSDWDHTLEARERGKRPDMRLGLRMVKGLKQDDATALTTHRQDGYDGIRHLSAAARLSPLALEHLASADAFRSVGLDRRNALWVVKGLDGSIAASRTTVTPLPLFASTDPESLRREEDLQLPNMKLGEHVVHDYATLSLSLKAHPLALLRPHLPRQNLRVSASLGDLPNGARMLVAGLVICRQRPGTAKGTIFLTLEDETGISNIIVWPKIFEAYRRPLLSSRLLCVQGRLQKQGLVIHIVAERLENWNDILTQLPTRDTEGLSIPAQVHDIKNAQSKHHLNTKEWPPSREMTLNIKSRDFH